MSYPLSSPVVAGDATEASQYNNLRKDALYLGGDPAGSGNLLQLLYGSIGTINLLLETDAKIRLSASAAEPCGLMIGGGIFSMTEDQTVTLNAMLMPAAGRYYLYAIGQNDGTFIMEAGDNDIPANGRMIGTFLWDGTGVIPGSLHNRDEWDAIRAVIKPSIANGRLTLAAGTPVPEADVTGDTLYFTPYNGNEIALYVGGEWEVFSFSELSLPLSGLTRELPYDIFLSADKTGLSLSSAAWGSSSARLTNLIYFGGVQVSSSDYGKRYLGTIALNSAGNGEDSITGRLVWNENNRVDRPLLAKITTQGTAPAAHMNKWAAYMEGNPAAVRLVVPDPDTAFELTGTGISDLISENDTLYGRAAIVGIGQDMSLDSYDDNSSCVPVFTESYGNSPQNVTIRNFGAAFRGYHKYTLAYYSNYVFLPKGLNFASSAGAGPGLQGFIRG